MPVAFIYFPFLPLLFFPLFFCLNTRQELNFILVEGLMSQLRAKSKTVVWPVFRVYLAHELGAVTRFVSEKNTVVILKKLQKLRNI
jgi:hypothetical protein